MEQMVYYNAPREETIDDLIRIFNCNNGLDEIDLGPDGLDFLLKDKRLQKINPGSVYSSHGRIYRDDFASMTTILGDFLAEIKENPAKKESSWEESSDELL